MIYQKKYIKNKPVSSE